jgi:Icc-related predicted phosphoesterase
MRFQVVSDLHLHFAQFELPETDADAIIIAGDLDNGVGGIDWVIYTARAQQKPILVVIGNHECYGEVYGDVARTWRMAFKKAGVSDFVTVLDKENPSLLFDDVIVLGATFWTDFHKNDPLSVHMSNYSMHDFQYIKKMWYMDAIEQGLDDRRFRAQDSYQEHLETIEVFKEARDIWWDQKLLVITHHAPSYKSIHSDFKNEYAINGAFVSDKEDLMEELRVHTWVHGHVHASFDYTVDCGTRVVCNPRGYEGTNDALRPDFDPSLIIEV